MPTLLQVTNSGTGGGLEKCVEWLAGAAVERGWGSTVAYWRGDAPESTARYLRLPAGRTPVRWATALGLLVRRLRPDIVHVHGSAPGSVGALAVRAAGCTALVFSSHELHHTMPVAERAARRAVSAFPVVNIAASTAVVESLVRAGVPADRVRLIRYGTPLVPTVRPPEAGAGALRRLVYVANPWPWKGHRVLLAALALLPPELSVDAVLVGDGVERPELEAEARRLGVHERVHFAGFLDDPWSVAEGAWAYVHPSEREALPLAVLEAMVRGLPVVASATGGIPDVVDPGRTGLLVPPGDAHALAQAIVKITDDRAERDMFARAAREDAVAEYSLSRWLDAHFNVYGDIASRSGSLRPSAKSQ